jgi:hypothetical protein
VCLLGGYLNSGGGVRVRGFEIPGRIVRTETSVQGHGLTWYPVSGRTYHDPYGEDAEYSVELLLSSKVPEGSVIMYQKGKNLWHKVGNRLYNITGENISLPIEDKKSVYVVNVDEPRKPQPWLSESMGEPIDEPF